MISLVVPFIDAFDKLRPMLQTAIRNAGSHDWELILIDNASKQEFDFSEFEDEVNFVYDRQEKNLGLIQSFKRGFDLANGEYIFYIHSDVLLHAPDWVEKIEDSFANDENLGLAGLFGARGIGDDGGRAWSISRMAGLVWGKCECHDIAAWHHGELIEGVHPAVVLDGVGMIFRRETMQQLIEDTNAFANWRSIFHFYDKILSLKTIELGYHVAVIGLEFDHWSGATANSSKTYKKTAAEWFEARGLPYDKKNPDLSVYELAEKQMFDEYRGRLPLNVEGDYNYVWNRQ